MLKLPFKSKCAPLTQRQYSEKMSAILEEVVYALDKRSLMVDHGSYENEPLRALVGDEVIGILL